ncbi:hypothetical protein GUJ93_ZPchr0013g34883 [Zizania palustris]|uniref:Uncharacterized protein n=1 Tax=Zizania palustris TaxID=103762 RepID=A0A8J5X5N1_ZIZPA|nr:hypothetical protein GUJ93_ZPchr0013g34883 [Zizania palustris]
MCLAGDIGKNGNCNSRLYGVELGASNFFGDATVEEKRWCVGLGLGFENGVVLVGGGEEARWHHHRTARRWKEGYRSSSLLCRRGKTSSWDREEYLAP